MRAGAPAPTVHGGGPRVALQVRAAECVHCGLCARACPPRFSAVVVSGPRVSIDQDACTGCGLCAAACPVGAIRPAP
ncbi:MAG TPA: 4Fe-4S binding protein [Acidimicrobiales bacterium]|nr:4Fe-4S binding protein [Acidimicrobiales bacterium]